ncbi:hypothetical protein D9619_012874 [Psilocybe cf. subviscida]|uniref:Uncharacterized protein n=1 Tax=Psilocybe cf. subviscida TaxID=2480587 RepID=A0A8H5BI87_9AGAR|nr:hypothetical protein D9619_012874 [Psilocybe cf. subviscida]
MDSMMLPSLLTAEHTYYELQDLIAATGGCNGGVESAELQGHEVFFPFNARQDHGLEDPYQSGDGMNHNMHCSLDVGYPPHIDLGGSGHGSNTSAISNSFYGDPAISADIFNLDHHDNATLVGMGPEATVLSQVHKGNATSSAHTGSVRYFDLQSFDMQDDNLLLQGNSDLNSAFNSVLRTAGQVIAGYYDVDPRPNTAKTTPSAGSHSTETLDLPDGVAAEGFGMGHTLDDMLFGSNFNFLFDPDFLESLEWPFASTRADIPSTDEQPVSADHGGLNIQNGKPTNNKNTGSTPNCQNREITGAEADAGLHKHVAPVSPSSVAALDQDGVHTSTSKEKLIDTTNIPTLATSVTQDAEDPAIPASAGKGKKRAIDVPTEEAYKENTFSPCKKSSCVMGSGGAAAACPIHSDHTAPPANAASTIPNNSTPGSSHSQTELSTLAPGTIAAPVDPPTLPQTTVVVGAAQPQASTPTSFRCHICISNGGSSKKYGRKAELNRHIRQKHMTGGVACHLCGDTLSNEYAVDRHIKNQACKSFK